VVRVVYETKERYLMETVITKNLRNDLKSPRSFYSHSRDDWSREHW
jgi:hypothetical protein